MDIERHIEHWRQGAGKSRQVVPYLMEGEYFAEAIFNMHLAVEKALKAHVVKVTQDHPPYIHNLLKLAAHAELELDEASAKLCNDLSLYQTRSRYGELDEPPPSPEQVRVLIKKSEEFFEWLMLRF